MPRHVTPFPPMLAVLSALGCFACMLAPSHARGDEGRWVELGIPLHSNAPMLWDEAGQRFVMVSGPGDDPVMLDAAWECDPGGAWRRFDLPAPPAVTLGAGMPWSTLADPAHHRFLFAWPRAAPESALALWTLELGPPVRWRQIDSTLVPREATLIQLAGDRVWAAVDRHLPSAELWSRSLADTGVWTLCRKFVISRTDAQLWPLVDAPGARLVRFGDAAAGGDSVGIWSASIDGTDDWRPEAVAGEVPTNRTGSVVVADTSRARVLLFGGWTQSGFHSDFWAYDLARNSWAGMGELAVDLHAKSLGIARDTLWVQGIGYTPYGFGVIGPARLALPLADPGRWVVAGDPPWPATNRFDAWIRNRAHDRWLGVGGWHAHWNITTPEDSLWALTLAGERASWQRIAIAGSPPLGTFLRGSAVDDLTGTAWVVSAEGNVWKLHLDDVPRWERVNLPGQPPEGMSEPVPPAGDLQGLSSVFDPVHGRIVFKSLFAGIAALELGGENSTHSGMVRDHYAIGLGGDARPRSPPLAARLVGAAVARRSRLRRVTRRAARLRRLRPGLSPLRVPLRPRRARSRHARQRVRAARPRRAALVHVAGRALPPVAQRPRLRMGAGHHARRRGRRPARVRRPRARIGLGVRLPPHGNDAAVRAAGAGHVGDREPDALVLARPRVAEPRPGGR
jgi:hypothetical protein